MLLVLADADAQHNKESDDAAQLKSGKRKRSAAVKKNDVEKNKNEDTCKASYSHWLMKSEPESRIENGVDVKVNHHYYYYLQELNSNNNNTTLQSITKV